MNGLGFFGVEDFESQGSSIAYCRRRNDSFSEFTFHPGVLLSANAEVEGSRRSGSYY